MPKQEILAVLEALRALYVMSMAEMAWPHGDCETVYPNFNVCTSCRKHTFCVNRWRLLNQISALAKLVGG